MTNPDLATVRRALREPNLAEHAPAAVARLVLDLAERVAALEAAAKIKPRSAPSQQVAHPRNGNGASLVCRSCNGAIERHEIGVWVHTETGRTLCKVSDE